MLDDHASRRVDELAHALPRGIRISEIVVRQLLALQLRERCQRARHRPQIAVKNAMLMWVFAVAQIHDLHEVAVVLGGEQNLLTIMRRQRREVIRNCRIVMRDAIECSDRQLEAGCQRQRSITRSTQLFDETRILRRRSGDGDAGVVFGGGTQHGRATNVDVLDDVFHRRRGIHRHGFKRVEIQNEQVDAVDPMLSHDFIIDARATEQATVHDWVQCLDAAIHHFGERCHFGNIADGQAGFAQGTCGATGGQQLHVEVGERLGEGDQIRFVRD